MSGKAASGILSTLHLISLLTVALIVQPVKAKPMDRTNLIILEFGFSPPVVTEGPVYDSVAMPGLPRYGSPGEPVLPFKTVRALIPQDKDVRSVDVTASNKKVLEGEFEVEYGKTPIPTSSNITVIDRPNQTIYSSANPYPGFLFSKMSEQYLRGYRILVLKLHPVQYVPKTGELSYFETVTVTINTIASDNASPFLRKMQQDRQLVLDIVDNPSEVESYIEPARLAQLTTLVNPSDSYNYVIVTNKALDSSFRPLIDWKIQKGPNATIVLVEDIVNDPNYHCNGSFGDGYGKQFNDTQAHIRNFIKDAYINWGTEYVLLGGDDDMIPARGVYAWCGVYEDYSIPCDMYYGTLDGSWDKDNDTIFGEDPSRGKAGEEADFFAEVYIGRATVDTPEEATSFVNKTLRYQQNPDASYLKKALMVGQTLDYMTEGGNGKDLVTDTIPQYTTTRLYDRDGTFSPAAVINEMNSGTHVVNHDGHAWYTSVMGLDRSDVDGLTNTDYFVAYSQGCYSAAFDGATSGPEDAIAEHFITSNGGAFAYIGNSRYGWYIRGSTDGPGDQYDRSFFDVLSEGIRNVGKALQLSKENLFDEYIHRWTYFTLNLLGDPEVEIVTDTTAPTAHFETRTDLVTPPHCWGTVSLRGTAKRGTAVGATFGNFTIEFGVGTNPSSWLSTGVSLTNNGESEVSNGTLATWNTSLVDDGTYTLRLTVTDVDGDVGEDWAVVIVHNTLTVHNVDTSLAYRTIQEAINAPETSDGHTIFVQAGTYYEHVVVNKSLSLVGENKHNTIIDGKGSTGNVVLITANNVNLTGFTIQGVGVSFDCGVFLNSTSHNFVARNDITNSYYGVSLVSSSNNIFYGNHITSNTYGVELIRSSNKNTFSRNNIANNHEGITLGTFCNRNFFSGNNIANNEHLGIGWVGCTKNVISRNTIINNNPYKSGFAVWISHSSKSTISRNDIANNDQGIFLYKCSESTISRNNIANNDCGVNVRLSSDNKFCHNNFVENARQVYDPSWKKPLHYTPSINIWDNGYPSGGNYWSDYKGTDANNDSIGDAPYVIDENNTDRYPLMEPWSPPPEYTLSICSLPTGVRFTVDDILYMTPWSGTYSEGASVSLVMPSTCVVGEARHFWTQWSDGVTSRSRTVIMNINITLTAYYTGYYELNVTSSPKTGVTFTIDGTPKTTPYTEWLPEGSYILVMPETHEGYVWWRWLEDGDTNRTKAITLPGTTWTGVFALLGDLNYDGRVDIIDIYIVILAFGSYPSHPEWNPNADVDKDNRVDIRDIYLVITNYGKSA